MPIIFLPQEVLYPKLSRWLPSVLRQDIEALSQDIKALGLLNPLMVMKTNGRYKIIDGKKRFQAIRKLTRRKMLPRTLHKVPCIVVEGASLVSSKPVKPLLLSDQDLVAGLLADSQKGASLEEVSLKYHCSLEVTRKALSLDNLQDKLKQAFMSGTINLDQAAAFATLPNPKSQWDLLVQLGPFVGDAGIISAIAAGETVIETTEGNAFILPSRSPMRPLENINELLKRAA
jgi:ParB-like chromosome segregation protein Spo0J